MHKMDAKLAALGNTPNQAALGGCHLPRLATTTMPHQERSAFDPNHAQPVRLPKMAGASTYVQLY